MDTSCSRPRILAPPPVEDAVLVLAVWRCALRAVFLSRRPSRKPKTEKPGLLFLKLQLLLCMGLKPPAQHVRVTAAEGRVVRRRLRGLATCHRARFRGRAPELQASRLGIPTAGVVVVEKKRRSRSKADE